MIITDDAALSIARLNLELALQQQQSAQDSDEYDRLTEWVRHCEHAVKGWEEVVARGGKSAFGRTIEITPAGAKGDE